MLLADHLSADAVFLDQEDLEWGRRWQSQLDDAVADRDVVIALIGAAWEGEDQSEESAQSRIGDPQDVVRREIAVSLSAGVEVLPVLVDRNDELWGAESGTGRAAHGIPGD